MVHLSRFSSPLQVFFTSQSRSETLQTWRSSADVWSSSSSSSNPSVTNLCLHVTSTPVSWIFVLGRLQHPHTSIGATALDVTLVPGDQLFHCQRCDWLFIVFRSALTLTWLVLGTSWSTAATFLSLVSFHSFISSPVLPPSSPSSGSTFPSLSLMPLTCSTCFPRPLHFSLSDFYNC